MNDVMSGTVLHMQIITTKIFKNISEFVRGNQYQNNVLNKYIPFDHVCVLW